MKINYSTIATAVVSALVVGVVIYRVKKHTQGIIDD